MLVETLVKLFLEPQACHRCGLYDISGVAVEFDVVISCDLNVDQKLGISCRLSLGVVKLYSVTIGYKSQIK